jgi:hypothetical protein
MMDRGVPAANDDRLAPFQLRRVRSADSQCRDAVQRGFNGPERFEKRPAAGVTIAQFPEPFQRNCVLFRKRSNPRAAQLGDVAV